MRCLLIGTKQVPFLKQVLVLSVSILAPPFPDTYRGMQSYSQCNGGECQADLPNGKPEANLHNGPGLLSRKLELSLHLGSETDDHCTFWMKNIKSFLFSSTSSSWSLNTSTLFSSVSFLISLACCSSCCLFSSSCCLNSQDQICNMLLILTRYLLHVGHWDCWSLPHAGLLIASSLLHKTSLGTSASRCSSLFLTSTACWSFRSLISEKV